MIIIEVILILLMIVASIRGSNFTNAQLFFMMSLLAIRLLRIEEALNRLKG